MGISRQHLQHLSHSKNSWIASANCSNLYLSFSIPLTFWDTVNQKSSSPTKSLNSNVCFFKFPLSPSISYSPSKSKSSLVFSISSIMSAFTCESGSSKSFLSRLLKSSSIIANSSRAYTRCIKHLFLT